MQYAKTIQTAAAALAALALTACASTAKPSATAPIKTVAVLEMPSAPFGLLVEHERPARPAGGSPEQLLNHAVQYGAYCQKLEAQVSGWQAWYRQGAKTE